MTAIDRFEFDRANGEFGGESAYERRFGRWLREAEKLFSAAGIPLPPQGDLDGDFNRDGFSLDLAHVAFANGDTPAAYLAKVNAELDARLGSL